MKLTGDIQKLLYEEKWQEGLNHSGEWYTDTVSIDNAKNNAYYFCLKMKAVDHGLVED